MTQSISDELATLANRVTELDRLVSRIPTRWARSSGGGGGVIQCILRSVDETLGELTIQKIKPATGDTTGLVATASGSTFIGKPRVGEHVSAFNDPAFIRTITEPETLDNGDPTASFFPLVAFMEAGVWRVMFALNTDAAIPVEDFATVQSEMQQS